METSEVRWHSSDDMAELADLQHLTEPVAVVLRQDGSVDVYGYVGVVDQREMRGSMVGQPCGFGCGGIVTDPETDVCDSCERAVMEQSELGHM